MTITYVIFGIAGLLASIVVWNKIHARWFYSPSRQEVANLLSRSLNGTAARGELDFFMCMPNHRDALLEQIRDRFASLYGPSSFEDDDSKTPCATWKKEARDQIVAMIDDLERGTS